MNAPVTDPDTRLMHAFIDHYPGEAVDVLDAASVDELMALIENEDTMRSVTILEKVSAESGAECINHLGETGTRRILPAMDVSRLADLLTRLDPPDAERKLACLPDTLARELRELMTYPPDTAGNLMDPRVLSFGPSMHVRDVSSRLKVLRQHRTQDIFIVDQDDQLIGALPLQDVILASPGQTLGELIIHEPIRVTAMTTREEVVELLTTHHLTSLPVVNTNGRLVGAIRHDTMVQAAQEESASDIQAMVGASRDERALSPATFAVRKRLPWLNINLLTAFLAAAVVGMFENIIAQFTALAVLLPVVAGQSGNTGAQALAVTMRGIALREVRLREWPRLIGKEAVAGLFNGIAIALVTAVGVFLWSQSIGLCFVIAFAMIFAMVIAGMAGAAIPVLLAACGQDPAQSSSIILTTVSDIVGFASFLGLATLFSSWL